MKIIFQRETERSGVLVIQSEPQTRTILIEGHSGQKTLNFPYLLYTLCYKKLSTVYKYEGIQGYGLRIYMSNKPLKSLLSKVYCSPTDLYRYGLICTPHELDNSSYDTVDKMAIKVIGSWWHVRHEINALTLNKWQKYTPESLLKAKYLDQRTGEFRFKDGINFFKKLDILPDRPKFISRNIGTSISLKFDI